jgi:hypothetical protein
MSFGILDLIDTDQQAIVPVLRSLADGGFQGPVLSDLGYRGDRLAQVRERLGISVEAITRGRDGQFVWLTGPSPGSVATGG